MIKLAIKNFLRDKGYFLTNCSAPGDLFFYEKYEKRSLEERKFYNIGPGDFKHQYWSNVDKFSDWYANDNKNCDLEYDLLKKDVLPIDNDSAEIVYSSHVIEHVWDEHVEVFMKEVYRVLKTNGKFWIYTDGSGAIAPDLWDYSRQVLEEIPSGFILDFLTEMGIETNKKYHLGDGLNAVYKHTSLADLTSQLGRIGFKFVRRLVRGYDTD